jgi:beta-phosphoglucomutase family hydrolase
VRFDDAAAVLFDLDGVLTPTAAVHMRAWEHMFSQYFAEHGLTPPYTDADYFAYVDGRPRYDGVRATLASRGVVLPEGEPSDPVGTHTVCGLGNTKNALVNQLLEAEGIEPYPGSVRLVDALERRGVPMAVVSSSRNAPSVLEAAGLGGRFGVVVDGVVAAAERLPGKPAPDTFRHAARLLGVPPERAVVVEDAVSGVAAGRAGGFGLVVGVDRGAGAEALLASGAHVVVADLGELV